MTNSGSSWQAFFARRDIWVAALCLYALSIAGMAILAPRLTVEALRPRPIGTLLILWFFACLGFTGLLGGVSSSKRRWLTALVLALLARFVLALVPMILENDPFRYQFDGNVVLAGENPYRHAPAIWPLKAGPNLAERLQRPGARDVLQRMGYPEITTVYPPASQALFAVGAWLTGWDWRGQRIVFLSVDLLVCWLLLVRCRDGNPSFAFLYIGNPLVLKEVANAAHMDVLVGLFLTLAVSCLYVNKVRMRHGIVCGLWLGLAVLSKLYPLIFVPCFVFVLRHQTKRWHEAVVMAATCGGIVMLGMAPFLNIPLSSLTAGLSRYADDWLMNQGLFSLLEWGFGDWARRIVFPLIGVTALAIAWRRRGSPIRGGLAGSIVWISLAWWLLMPSPFPWYGLPLLALIALTQRGSMLVIGVVFTFAAVGYYAGFYLVELDARSLRPITGWLAHAFVWAVLIASWLGRKSPSTIGTE